MHYLTIEAAGGAASVCELAMEHGLGLNHSGVSANIKQLREEGWKPPDPSASGSGKDAEDGRGAGPPAEKKKKSILTRLQLKQAAARHAATAFMDKTATSLRKAAQVAKKVYGHMPSPQTVSNWVKALSKGDTPAKTGPNTALPADVEQRMKYVIILARSFYIGVGIPDVQRLVRNGIRGSPLEGVLKVTSDWVYE